MLTSSNILIHAIELSLVVVGAATFINLKNIRKEMAVLRIDESPTATPRAELRSALQCQQDYASKT